MGLPTLPKDQEWKDKTSDTPWININTVDDTMPFYECGRCRDTAPWPPMPIDIMDLVAHMNAFVEEHSECEECNDCEEGFIEIGTCGTARCQCDGFSGGCTYSEPCSNCNYNYEPPEPDYDAIADERREERGARDEVDWEAPE